MFLRNNDRLPDAIQMLGTILSRCRDKWFRFALRIVRNHADAEDALQEGFCRVLASRKAFHTEDQARMYLARTISNAAIEIYHERVRNRRSNVPARESQLADRWRDNPLAFLERRESQILRSQARGLLGQALRRLPAKQYEALRMTIMDPRESSIRDAGEIHGIAYSTLRHRRVQGLRHLRKYISKTLRHSPMRMLLA